MSWGLKHSDRHPQRRDDGAHVLDSQPLARASTGARSESGPSHRCSGADSSRRDDGEPARCRASAAVPHRLRRRFVPPLLG